MADAIWKDKYINLGTDDSAQFRVMVGTSVIYTGKAFKRPGESAILIRINDICADYFNNVLPYLSQAEFEAITLPVTFKVQVYTTAWTDKATIQFINDWSYEDYDAGVNGLSVPINGIVDSRQWIVYTAYNQSSITATLKFKDGTTQSVVIAISRSNDFNDDFNIDFSRSTASAGSGSAVLDLSAWTNLAQVTIGSAVYRVVDTCHQYALHYINAYGGWNSLLIEGNSIENDTITRSTREVEYDNRSAMNRGIRNYVNEISKGFTFYTGWLNDNESSKMHHLIGSTDVYLEDIPSGKFIPVTIDNTNLEYKTYKNQGNRLVNYEIAVTIAQDRVRR